MYTHTQNLQLRGVVHYVDLNSLVTMFPSLNHIRHDQQKSKLDTHTPHTLADMGHNLYKTSLWT